MRDFHFCGRFAFIHDINSLLVQTVPSRYFFVNRSNCHAPSGCCCDAQENSDTLDQERQSQQSTRLADFHARDKGEAQMWVAKLGQTVMENGNVFAVLMDVVRYCSLRQLPKTLYEVGDQYRRNVWVCTI